jgi:hypothetical protein
LTSNTNHLGGRWPSFLAAYQSTEDYGHNLRPFVVTDLGLRTALGKASFFAVLLGFAVVLGQRISTGGTSGWKAFVYSPSPAWWRRTSVRRFFIVGWISAILVTTLIQPPPLTHVIMHLTGGDKVNAWYLVHDDENDRYYVIEIKPNGESDYRDIPEEEVKNPIRYCNGPTNC